MTDPTPDVRAAISLLDDELATQASSRRLAAAIRQARSRLQTGLAVEQEVRA